MDVNKILSVCDHTNLKIDATWKDIKQLCDDAIMYRCASVCIPPAFVKQAAEYAKNNMTEDGYILPICTVIGFPNGYNTTAVKCAETSEAVDNGADEIDMVINIGWAKEGRWEDILSEINAIKESCKGKLLKVIIETCVLSEEEKIAMCDVVSKSNADYIKTSTGFSTGGATFADVELMRRQTAAEKKVKAAGGIANLEDAARFMELGADRLGTSRVVKCVKES